MNIAHEIDKARQGRSQWWIVKCMNEMGIRITETQFSRKKYGHSEFTDQEIKALKKIIGLKHESKRHTIQ